MPPTPIVTEDHLDVGSFMSPVQTQQGFAFEIPIKSPCGSGGINAVRQRLEQRLTSSVPSPTKTLLRRESGIPEERAQKAHEKNEQKRLTTEKAGADIVERKLQLCNEVEAKAERATKKREEALTRRRTKAARHFEAVKAKKEVCQRLQAENADALQQRLSGLALQKDSLHAASLAKRGAYAGQHNSKVAGKVFQHQVKQCETSGDDIESFVNAVTASEGFSFEIPVNASHGTKVASPAARQRESAPGPASPTKEKASLRYETAKERAEKAHEKNEQKREAVERVQAEAAERALHLGDQVASKAKRAAKQREEALTRRRRRAAKHFAEVEEKKGFCQQRLTEDSESRLQRLCKVLGQKNALHLASLSRRRAHARQHNNKVAGKAFQHQVRLQDGVEPFVNAVETAEGFSFEIPVNASHGTKVVSPAARQRFESATGPASPTQAKAPLQYKTAKERAEKAHEKNEQKREAVERAQAEAAERAMHLGDQVASKAKRAAKQREEALTRRRRRAAKHFAEVEEKKGFYQQRLTEDSESRLQRLCKILGQKNALHLASLSRRRAHARQHNNKVAGKVFQHQVRLQDGVEPFVNAVETAEGFSFEIPVNASHGTKVVSPAARQRFESATGPASPTQAKAPLQYTTAKERAEKAHEKNEQKREAVERAQAEAAERAMHLGDQVASKAKRAAEQREEALTRRRRRAAKHFAEVEEKKGFCQQRLTEDSESRLQRLRKVLGQKNALRLASLSRRRAHARQHNTKVAGKVFQYQVKQQDGVEPFVNPVETAEGFSFEIRVKSPHGGKVAPSLLERLEGRAEPVSIPFSGEKSSAPTVPFDTVPTVSVRAEKAQQQNELKRQAMERAQSKQSERRQQLRDQVMVKAARAAKISQEVLANRGTRAGKHIKMVEERRDVRQKLFADSASACRARLSARAHQTDALHDSSIDSRRAYAGRHNKIVAGKFQKRQCKRLAKEHEAVEAEEDFVLVHAEPSSDVFQFQPESRTGAPDVGTVANVRGVAGSPESCFNFLARSFLTFGHR